MPTPIKILFLKLIRIDLLAYKVKSLEIESFSLRKHLKLGVFFTTFLNNWQKGSKDRRNTPPSLKFLEQRVHELVGVLKQCCGEQKAWIRKY